MKKETNFEKFLNLQTSLQDSFFGNLIYLSPWITFFYYFTSDIALLFEKSILENKIANKKEIQLLNFKCLRDLTNIKQVFICKNCLLEKNRANIEGFLLNDIYIELNEKERKKIKDYFFMKNNENISSFK